MGKKGNGKKPKNRERPTPVKAVRQRESPESSNTKQPVWLFCDFDHESEWGIVGETPEVAATVISKLQSFETMTWAEIEAAKKQHHSVSVEQFSPDAKKRFAELNLDVDELFRFRLNGLNRLWGIRDRERFKIVWWDPMHKVCPSKLKHT